jgi:hypothetical protein
MSYQTLLNRFVDQVLAKLGTTYHIRGPNSEGYTTCEKALTVIAQKLHYIIYGNKQVIDESLVWSYLDWTIARCRIREDSLETLSIWTRDETIAQFIADAEKRGVTKHWTLT